MNTELYYTSISFSSFFSFIKYFLYCLSLRNSSHDFCIFTESSYNKHCMTTRHKRLNK